MEMLRKLPIGIQTFEDIRENHFLYVDKTPYVWDLASQGKAYFLSRPRRFGKSLFVSTLEAYFSGRKDLFEGLAIEALENAKGEQAWEKYPVVTFSLSGGGFNSENGLADALNYVLEDVAQRYELNGKYHLSGETLPVRFQSLLRNLYRKTGRRVVVLVDEYDKPLLETMIVNEKQEEANRQLFKEFFSILKDEDRYLRFEFLTGVTKFSKVSLFSDLNHLDDISLMDDFSGICGITAEEMESQFRPEINRLAGQQGISEGECLEKLARTYDGYHFSARGDGVYNPFSLLCAFRHRQFGNFWFESGTPTFAINKLRASGLRAEQIVQGVDSTEDELINYRGDDPNPIPLLYQSGYLTISGYDQRFQIYSLDLPNEEVKKGFLNSLIPMVLGYKEEENPLSLRNMIMDLERGCPEMFLTRLKSLFASIPYPEGQAPAYELIWRDQIFLVLELIGTYVESEVHTSTGRCDCVIKTTGFIYVLEFKLDKSAQEALDQIDSKDYTCRYEADPRKIYKIGINFVTKTRNVEEWLIEE